MRGRDSAKDNRLSSQLAPACLHPCFTAAVAHLRRSGPTGPGKCRRPAAHGIDVHFNPMADPSLVADLAAADLSQWETILQRSKPTAFSSYGQDTNWWLLQSALDAMVPAEPQRKGPAILRWKASHSPQPGSRWEATA